MNISASKIVKMVSPSCARHVVILHDDFIDDADGEDSSALLLLVGVSPLSFVSLFFGESSLRKRSSWSRRSRSLSRSLVEDMLFVQLVQINYRMSN